MANIIAFHAFNISSTVGSACYTQSNVYSQEQLPTVTMSVHDYTPAKQVVDFMLHLIGASKVQILRTVAHGDSGFYRFPHMWVEAGISLEYARLTRTFATNARFELHGCGIASETSILKDGVAVEDATVANTVSGTFSGRSTGRGLKYLRKVASTFGVPVTAGVDVQIAEPNKFTFEGDTVTVYPNGKFRYDSEGTRTWDLEAINRAAMDWLRSIDQHYIEAGDVTQGRAKLKELIAKYPKTPAATEARRRLGFKDLKGSQQLPDGSWTL